MGMLLCNSGITEAQIFFLAGVYLMMNMRPMPAWKMFVQALACCQGFTPSETAVEPANLSNLGTQQSTRSQDHDQNRQSESQLHKSIYWTCFKSEL
jgi:hypothetical protein